MWSHCRDSIERQRGRVKLAVTLQHPHLDRQKFVTLASGAMWW
jgi:hypothetical protein